MGPPDRRWQERQKWEECPRRRDQFRRLLFTEARKRSPLPDTANRGVLGSGHTTILRRYAMALRGSRQAVAADRDG
jgi:hypothetical protein